ncbi:MAG: ABC transporter substrate-binding protein, partial [Bacteroidetes bacterium]|nr:ABC transporter substrate-binding protein [Bacteroidota bacterium]
AQTLNQSVSSPTTTIKIGLVIPDPEALAAKHGAELAIREANRKGGYEGRQFHLVIRSTEGPWGTGSKVSVNLVFDEEVVTLMGSLDGRNAHLVEQVATKTRIALLSAWATDITLSQAFIPWYFRCVPNDDQQAFALIQEIYKKRKITSVAIIGTEDYDSRFAVRSFIQTTDSMKIAAPRQLLYRSSAQDFQMVAQDIDQYDIEAVVLFGKPALASDIMPLLQQKNKDLIIFGSLSIMDNQKASGPDWNILEGTYLVSSGHWFTEKGIAFQKEFQKVYGYQPGPVAAYAFDGINVIIEVIKKAGPDRDKIIDAFSKIDYKAGITGEIQFDKNGNRTGKVGLMRIKDGKPVFID